MMRKQVFKIVSATILGFLLMGADPAFATGGFNSVVTALKTSVSNLPVLLSVVCYLAGIGFVLFSLFRLKTYVESPGNMPLKNVLAMFFIGGALLAAPTIVAAATSSFGQGTDDSRGNLYQSLKTGIGKL